MRFPYAEVQFDSSGAIHDPDEREHAVETAAASGVTDLLVLSHGWNNDIPTARAFYDELTGNIADVLPTVPGAAGLGLAVVGVLWPAIRWADPDLIPGGGARIADSESLLRAEIRDRVAGLGVADRLCALSPDLEVSPAARAEFLRLLRSLVPYAPDDSGHRDDPDDEEKSLLTLMKGDTEDVFTRAGSPDPVTGFFNPWDAARNLLNATTYFTMKERAAQIGLTGVAQLLDAMGTRVPTVRRHLAGHSFGARLVSAAALRHAPVHSITLLQAAFSHHGFATDYDGVGSRGFFRPVLDPGRLAGPLVITHTPRDLAVGVAYAIISRLAGQQAAGLPGGPGDPYGGLGCNGAVKTPQVVRPPDRLLPVGGSYVFTAGHVHNLLSDSFITSHSDVGGREVANVLLHAICSR